MRRAGAAGLVLALAGGAHGEPLRTDPTARVVTVFLDETWTDNVRFAEVEERDSITRVGSRLELHRARPRSDLKLSGEVQALRHLHSSELDQLFYAGRLSAARQLTRRTRVGLEEGYRLSYAGDARTLPELAVADPLARSRTNDLHGDVSRQLSRRTSAGVSLRHTHVSFDGEALQAGDRLTLHVRLERQTSRFGNLRLLAEREWSWTGEPVGDITRAGGHWSTRAGTLKAEAGAGALAIGVRNPELQPFGQAGLSVEGERASLALRYERSVSAAFGIGGLQSMDHWRAAASWRPLIRLRAGLEAERVLSRSPASEAQLVATDQLQADLAYALGPRLRLRAAGRLLRREPASGGTVTEASSLLVSFEYAHGWR